MKNTFTLLSIFMISSYSLLAQSTDCDGTAPFVEEDGLLTIEMESGNIPTNSNWNIGEEPDPNKVDATINYLFWDGPESFRDLAGSPIRYNIRINNPGTYRLLWRSRIGTGDSNTEHNDIWLKIEADDFYANKKEDGVIVATVEPTPSCNTNPSRDCAEGNKVDGFFKAYMNTPPTNEIDRRWMFVTNTNDKDAFRCMEAVFNTAGDYAIIIDARSSFFFIDKMILFRNDVNIRDARNLNNPESSCTNTNLSTVDIEKSHPWIISPNPAFDTLTVTILSTSTANIVIRNIMGAVVQKASISGNEQTIDIRNLAGGMYFIADSDSNIQLGKFIKR